ncbi:MAG: UDP-N-acetylmuramate dehydrogenase [Candidatus Pacebacteria bacterium]|nr:UDP-N-acetylmuramate dehydrogenase [Candidatus Paceibacterota bacterium]MCF7856962.1 UDP-N-acetylmuramate dehydrogenase [Candidatus Paceibacterota bacterium]
MNNFNIQQNIPLAQHTTLGIGGMAEYFVEVKTESELMEALTWAGNQNLAVTVLGGGSNVLIADEGVSGVVIKMSCGGIFFKEDDDGVSILASVSAGESWDRFVEATAERALWGLENLSGIPGRVGAAPVQNINAYGVSVGDVIERVHAINISTREKVIFTKEECKFAYRDSFFKTEKGREYIITSVQFRLTSQNDIHTTYKSSSQSIEQYFLKNKITSPNSEDVRRAVLFVRKNIGMLDGIYKSAGSFFKNIVLGFEEFKELQKIIANEYQDKSEIFAPWHWILADGTVKVSTAFLMECTEYNKAYGTKSKNGVVGISPLHTLSIINYGNARSRDVKIFSDNICDVIQKKFGVEIEKEVCYLE